MSTPPPKVIDTTAALTQVLEDLTNLPNLPSDPPSLYIDLEGINLSRHGSISIMQIYVLPLNEIYLIDIHVLGQTAFTTTSATGTTLKSILESSTTQKAFFDVRNDSDALYSQFGVYLSGIQDIQLLELATRSFSRRCINGLAKAIERDGGLTLTEAIEWNRVKENGRKLFAPERGGSYEVFNARPLSEKIIRYCAQDVRILPMLWRTYSAKLRPTWKERVKSATKERIDVCFQAGYTGVGRHMALAPAGWA
ncbi:hypothetical protein BDW74DRAFT_173945 [Aspergillus multicolor]|uniref:uncharacterized protein n=1 Tax=Aspergillus multicolor TaxID=41759 RepID=UPI003CCDDE05